MTESPTAQSFAKAEAASPPFDSARLDALLDEAGMDAAVISSKHNIQYLFGGYRFFFFDHFDAIGVSRPGNLSSFIAVLPRSGNNCPWH